MKRTWSVELQDRIGEGETERVRGLVRDACSMYREVLIHRARYLLQQGGLKAHRESWIPIASLYQLRQIVGGRFSSLRERWLNAGFSLLNRDGVLEERQDSDGKGWLTITSWLLRNGFEARKGDSTEKGSLFFVRRITPEVD